MLYTILAKTPLHSEVTRMDILAPRVAGKAEAGQFVIVRTHELGERFPLTIACANKETGSVTIIYQKVGHSTRELDRLSPGDAILDLVGPLGRPTDLGNIQRAIVVGGGLGSAIAWPIARALHNNGALVDMIVGFRNQDLVILENELRGDCHKLHICTDDGSYGRKGFVTDTLRELLTSGSYDEVFAIGPPIMMKFVSLTTKEFGVKTTVSLNPLMVDGTGMCGCCRVTVDGAVRFACVDGPDFDGHLVDFDELMHRQTAYQDWEQAQNAKHICHLTGEVRS